MQMQAMNQFGNRGYGGPPQPQRQGGRRGNNRGGFRNSRFDFEPNPQRNQNQGQRPNNNEERTNTPVAEKPAQQQQSQQNQPINKPPQNQQQNVPPQNQPQQQNKTPQQSQQQSKPPQQQQQIKPSQQLQQNKPPQQQQQNKPPQQQQQNKPPLQQNKPQQQPQQLMGLKLDPKLQVASPAPQQNQLPAQNAKLESQDNVDKAINEPKGSNQNANQNQQQPKNMNGNFGGNKPGGWNQGGPGNKQGGVFNQGNRPFANRGQGGLGGQGGQGGGPGGQAGPGGPARNQQRGGRGGQQMDGKPPMREEHMLANKLRDLAGPLVDIPQIDQSEVKFNGRSRLYIGNLTSDVTEEEITTMFSAFGECSELFLNKEKNFGFIKMDFRVNAERAKRELDGKMRSGRNLRVRFAPHNCAIRVKNLPPWVSNELLYRGFEIFGRIERAYVRVDERGKPLGEGIVEYSRKPSALAAIRNCTEKCFFLTASLRPVIVESFEEPDEFDGYPEKNLPKKHPEFLKAREFGPRFSELNSFEHEYGTRWKQLHELHRQKEEALKKELASEEEKLEAQMEYAKYEHETELLREQLRQREQDRERQKRSWEMAERAAETRRDTERAQLLRQEEELAQRMRQQDDELRRRQQENTLFVQAQRLNSMLDRQEQGMFDQQSPMEGGFREQFDMPRGNFDDVPQGRGGWEGPRQMDDYPNKRRRY